MQAIDRQAGYTAYNPQLLHSRAIVSQASRRFVSDSWPFLFPIKPGRFFLIQSWQELLREKQ